MISMADDKGYGWKEGHKPGSVDVLEQPILDHIRRYGGGRIIDIGCGNGATARFLTDQGLSVDGVEPDEAGFTYASRLVPEGRFFNLGVEAAADDILQGGEKYDIVLSTEVIEHLYYPSQLIRLARDLLKPDGHLILTTPYHGFAKNLALALTNHWDAHFSSLWEGGHIKFFSFATMQRLIESNGMTMVSTDGAGRIPYLWNSMIVVAKPGRPA